jgi:hypothetical protein
MLEGPELVCRLYAVVPAEEAAGLRACGFGAGAGAPSGGREVVLYDRLVLDDTVVRFGQIPEGFEVVGVELPYDKVLGHELPQRHVNVRAYAFTPAYLAEHAELM